MKKKKKIKLSDYRELGGIVYQGEPFRVEQIVNSTTYKIGQYLSKGEVQRLCSSDTSFDVTIVAPKPGK